MSLPTDFNLIINSNPSIHGWVVIDKTNPELIVCCANRSANFSAVLIFPEGTPNIPPTNIEVGQKIWIMGHIFKHEQDLVYVAATTVFFNSADTPPIFI
ncbi:hypothetical protein PGT21_007193 [Puccinia graminis f. sp. tritici]|uniref:Uncharacterized protein n=2 Tax=Puccinia graminis f. sp. tritici TaxID=56615 RepID=H6QR24_PUCGT|nr:uncharacterized protein PGTG_21291 [Puccinia graminis f. sp. tritici CRL 75-36-700-3]XP_003890521.1 uncharacterized protein PGTG_20812 [Puccinia graminis f. sp. tritici CRL 75-36-700-3]XP_003890875.1 uncharacterized protein PGTG_22796 [Puccinia graminis f. sp. tritici CRL 75-36-700-3]KAA1118823.1 hypothetical protein PGT21_007193 [Puccinia graminis f. sp. tritici]EHS62999.1 hypothetical protein PGTG_21291 [Puccinia graminis f. sp. tritici CRL 75-36-700-3]EHS63381.1 hypothetical protein PGTG